MGERSEIAWTDATFNPWMGCTKVSAGCKFCYAEKWDSRQLYEKALHWGPGVPRRLASDEYWQEPLAWNRKAEKAGEPLRVFCASLADVFDAEVPPEWRKRLFDLIARTPRLTWLLLTKRPENIPSMLPADWGDGWPNVWPGTSTEDQEAFDTRASKLLAIPAVAHFLSCEPLLGGIDIETFIATPHPERRWVIAGGESGNPSRSMDLAWARSLQRQCESAGVPFFMKQLGRSPFTSQWNSERAVHEDYPFDVDHPKGGDMSEWPSDLCVRQFPVPRFVPERWFTPDASVSA